MSLEVLTNGAAVNGQNLDHEPPLPELRKNDSHKSWVVQKFGGTSVGKVPTEIAEDIIKQHLLQHRVVVVCSAISSDTKADGTTNRLLRAAKEVEKNETKKYESTVHAIQNDHIEASKRWVSSPVIRGKLLQDLETICTELILFLGAVERVGEVSPRTLDTIISTGEILSCRIMVAILQDRGVDSTLVDLSHASKNFPCSHGLNQDFYTHLTSVLSSKVKQCGNSVPVVTGFFGTITGGLMNKIGRGYTDLCAALIAVGLGAEVLQVWKEVDGIFTANPHKVPTARLLPTISPAESAELTFLGSEVIHPFTMEQVIRARIPIRIRNVMNLRNQGTIIVPEPLPERPRSTSSNGSSSKLFRSRHSWQVQSGLRPKRPTAITVKPSILVLNVHSNKRSLSHGFFANIFSVLDKWRLSVDLISTSEVHVSMALHSESVMVSGEDDKEILDADLRGAVEELAEFGTVDLMDSMAILSLVGKQMKNMPGIAGKMFSVLGENNVNIEMISQGASEINISCVIEERDADRAINILHTNLFTFLD